MKIDLITFLEFEKVKTEEEEKLSEKQSCTFWRSNRDIDYSGYFFAGAIYIDGKGNKKSPSNGNYKDEKNGTWGKFLKSSKIFVSDTKGQFIRIDQNDYKIKYLAKIFDTEEDEIISNITWIDGKILSKGVWVHISLALPYKTLTKQQAIDMIKSVEVVRGFDMEIK